MMTKTICPEIETLRQSPVRAMFDLAARVENLLDFTLGEPDFATPEHISRAAGRALQEGKTHYTPNAGILPLREAIAEKLWRENGIEADPGSEILVTAGGTEALSLIFKTLLEPGDEVLIQDPLWPTCTAQIAICGGKAVPVRLYEEDGFRLRAENVERAVTPRTKALVVNTPQNPTGAVIPKEGLLALARVARAHNLYLVADEVYQKLLYDGREHFSIASAPEFRERVITVDSFSKSYAMTGWRVGYLVANAHLVDRMTKLHEFYSSCVNTPAQYGAVAALTGGQDCVEYMHGQYEARRKLVLDGVNAIPGLRCASPGGAFYAFLNIRETGMSSQEFAVRLLRDTGVALAPGSGFGGGGEGFVRLCYANSLENLERGLERLDAFMRERMGCVAGA